jgi:DnaJ-class molecular chaperone
VNTAQQKRDYFEVLGVDRSASQEQIKQTYRQLALKWHPDRNPAPGAVDRFREIAEAYAVLSDETKRSAYAAAGHAGVSERWSTEDIFRDFDFGDFFGGRFADLWNIFGDLFGGHGRRNSVRSRGADLHCDMRITLEDAAKGGERRIHITRPGPYSGPGAAFLPRAVKIRIPMGAQDGALLRFVGQGQTGPHGGPPGDLLVRLSIQPHPSLRREGHDLYAVARIAFPEAALGTKVTIKYLGNENVLITVPPGTQNGALLRLRGKGMPRPDGEGKGDLLVIVKVKTPIDLTERQCELLREFKLESAHKQAAPLT